MHATDHGAGGDGALYEHAPCGLLVTDDDGLVLRANATFCGWAGIEAAALVGKRRFQDLLTVGGRIFHQTQWMPLLRMQGSVAEVFLHPQHATTKRFVQEAEQVDENEQRDDFAHVQGRILRLTFQGEATYAPLLGTIARQTGVDYSILAGRIDRIKDTPYGQLTLALTGGDLDAAIARFQAADVHLEVLR